MQASVAVTRSAVVLNESTHASISIFRFGLGTWLSTGKGECKGAVLEALKSGYRLIDTAAMYDNEEDVGEAIKESKIPREELFVVTKLSTDDHGEVSHTRIAADAATYADKHVDAYKNVDNHAGTLVKTCAQAHMQMQHTWLMFRH